MNSGISWTRRLSTLPSTREPALASRSAARVEHRAAWCGRPGSPAPRRRRRRRARRHPAPRAPADRRGPPSRSPGELASIVSRRAAGWMMPAARWPSETGTTNRLAVTIEPWSVAPARSDGETTAQRRDSSTVVGRPLGVAVDSSGRDRDVAREHLRELQGDRAGALAALGPEEHDHAGRAIAQRRLERDAQRGHLAQDVLADRERAEQRQAAAHDLARMAERRGHAVPGRRRPGGRRRTSSARRRCGSWERFLRGIDSLSRDGHGVPAAWRAPAGRGRPRPGRRCEP